MKTQDNTTGSKWLGGLILIIIVGGIIAFAVSSQSKNPTNDTSTQQTTEPAKATSKNWDYEENYNKIQNGMTKAEVEAAIDRKSENCAETAAEEINLKVESCNYGMPPDNGMISVTFENGKVTTKAKAAF